MNWPKKLFYSFNKELGQIMLFFRQTGFNNCPINFNLQEMYGGFGKKPNKELIGFYEHFALGNSNDLKISRMLKVTVSRYVSQLLVSPMACKEGFPFKI